MQLETNRAYKHKSGKIYTLLAISNLEATKDGWEQQAVYIDENGVVWTRPAKEFKEKMILTDEKVSFFILPLLSFQEDKKIMEDDYEVSKYPENGM